MANIVENRQEALEAFQDRLGYHFHDLSLLETAFVHRSILNEEGRGLVSNERLEFLGDAVLELVVSDALYRAYPDLPEGELTKRRIQLVCEPSFAYLGEEMGIPPLLLLGHGAELQQGRKKDSLVSDAFEAVCGAIYLDGGLSFLMELFSRQLNHMLEEERGEDRIYIDYKSRLQVYLNQHALPFEYRLLKQEGPDHHTLYTVALYIDGKKEAEGQAYSKKRAEQEASKLACHHFPGVEPLDC